MSDRTPYFIKMPNSGKRWLQMLIVLIAMVGNRKAHSADALRPTNQITDSRMLIVIAAPSVYDPYYREVFQQTVEFDVQLAQAIMGNDNVVVLADKDTMPYLAGRLPEDILIETDVPDIWLRDFTAVSPSKAVQFVYRPLYLDPGEAMLIQAGINRFIDRLGLQLTRSKLTLDGGNVVDNNRDKAVVTERVLRDNPTVTREHILEQLKATLGLTQLAIIPEEAGDTTGHADGMVLWVSEDTLFVNKYAEPFRTRVLTALRDGLPGVSIIEVQSEMWSGVWRGFTSACGVNFNAIVTHNFIYAPVFGKTIDAQFLETIKRYTDKHIKTIPAEKVCFMGGSVRCLTWQLTGENARKLIETAQKRKNDASRSQL